MKFPQQFKKPAPAPVGIKNIRQHTLDEADRNETVSLIEQVRQAQSWVSGLLPADKKLVIQEIARLPSSRPLLKSDGSVDPFEFTRRVIRLVESSTWAIKSTSEKPRPHPDKGGGPRGKSPTPGAYSGARREPSTAWHGELRT